ncbi:helix-turn-helix domain-containing protein [Mycolicibacterium peregrinum]|uniref:helix-turn-helix domain-containing protein n=1 Tax=Mycolicibacterium peregrinum TaxID=43304 RepID=UPI003AAC09D5
MWLTVQGAAEYLKVSEPIIRDAVKRGDLPAYPIGKGREYRLTAEDIDSWMLSKSWEPRSYYKTSRLGVSHEQGRIVILFA